MLSLSCRQMISLSIHPCNRSDHTLNLYVEIQKCTWFTNSFPWSVIIFLTMPNVYILVVMIADTSAAVLEASGSAITHFVNKSVMVRTNLFPRPVSGNGPIRSRPTTSHGSFTCMSQKGQNSNVLMAKKKLTSNLMASSGNLETPIAIGLIDEEISFSHHLLAHTYLHVNTHLTLSR